MVYTFFGIILGSLVLNIVPLTPENRIVETIAELTLIFILATDASRIDVRGLFRDHNLPTRLLGIGLPLTMVIGTITAVMLFTQLSVWEAVILAVVLTPTDASLGQSVVSNPKVPVSIRQALNIESGLNDGITMPFLLLAIAMAESEVIFESPFVFLISVSTQIILGVVVGILVGYASGKFVEWGRKSSWMSEVFQKISSLILILLAYGLAEAINGNGFIAAFCFGLAFREIIGAEETEDLYEYAEIEITLLMLITFVLFGAVLLPHAIETFTPIIVLYAVLSLTLVRMLSVVIALVGVKVHAITSIFLGWFGPRGIASILYIFIVLESKIITFSVIFYWVHLKISSAFLILVFSFIVRLYFMSPIGRWPAYSASSHKLIPSSLAVFVMLIPCS